MSLISDIKRDREAARCFEFHWIGDTLMAKEYGEAIEICNVGWSPLDECEAENARRIARVPDMEAALLAAEELADALKKITDRGVSPATGGRLILEIDVVNASEALIAYREATQ